MYPPEMEKRADRRQNHRSVTVILQNKREKSQIYAETDRVSVIHVLSSPDT